MRLKLTLYSDSGNLISYNYHYHLSSAIYKLLQFGSKEFSRFLHDSGFKLNGKKYKLFTFALRFEKYSNLKETIRLDDPKVYLYISSPLIDNFIHNFVLGTIREQSINISDVNFPINFTIKFVETVPLPEISEKITFKLLNPMVLSTVHSHNGKISQYFLRENDTEDINRILTQNLRNKYYALFRQDNLGILKLRWDSSYITRTRRITKKVTINEHGSFPIDIIGMQAPFTICGDPNLIKVGYECGFGEKNSMGFGMTEVT